MINSKRKCVNLFNTDIPNIILISLFSAALTVGVGYIVINIYTPFSLTYMLLLGAIQIISLMALSYIMNESGCNALFLDKQGDGGCNACAVQAETDSALSPLPNQVLLQPNPMMNWPAVLPNLPTMPNTSVTLPTQNQLPSNNVTPVPSNNVPEKNDQNMTPEQIRQMFACVCEPEATPPSPPPTLSTTVLYPSMKPVVLPTPQNSTGFDFVRMFGK